MNNTEKKFKDNISVILSMIEKNEPKVSICRILKIKQDTLNKYLKKYFLFHFKLHFYVFAMSKYTW